MKQAKYENKRKRIPKGISKMDNSEKEAIYGTQDDAKQQQKSQHNMCLTPKHFLRVNFNI